jgi:hypothetical protein
MWHLYGSSPVCTLMCIVETLVLSLKCHSQVPDHNNWLKHNAYQIELTIPWMKFPLVPWSHIPFTHVSGGVLASFWVYSALPGLILTFFFFKWKEIRCRFHFWCPLKSINNRNANGVQFRCPKYCIPPIKSITCVCFLSCVGFNVLALEYKHRYFKLNASQLQLPSFTLPQYAAVWTLCIHFELFHWKKREKPRWPRVDLDSYDLSGTSQLT